jgi:protein-S-isoprenylcysteine O-methyltransferase Ste14
MRASRSAPPTVLALAYGVAAYVLFLGTFLYAIGFVTNLVVPKSIDGGDAASLTEALLVNGALLALFAIQHSVMARPAFKAWWTRLVPAPIERSTYVICASLVLLLLFWQWRPVPTPVWDAGGVLGTILQWLGWLGWLTVLLSTFMIDHFDLFGLRQVVLHARGVPYSPPPFHTRALYRLVRHPIMLGFLVAFWATPRMTAGHLIFALATTGYVLIAIRLEERDLLLFHGAEYEQYRQQVRMLIPMSPRKQAKAPRTASG